MEADGAAGASGGEEFLGQYRHTLDAKGRVILPSAVREQLQEGLVMTIGPDSCLLVYPEQKWQRVVENLRALRFTDGDERRFGRMMLSSAHRDTLDRQGRVTVPGFLRDYASLTKDVTVVGADVRLELWDTPRWERYREQGLADVAHTNQAFDMGGVF